MKATRFHAYVLAGLIALFGPTGQVAVSAAAPAVAPAAQTAATMAKPEAKKATTVDMAKVSEKVQKQTQEKEALRDRLAKISGSGGARQGEPVDQNQVSVRELVANDGLKADAVDGGFAYVQSYVEPNDYAHRNYCGAGAAAVLISHFDAGYAGNVDIDGLGEEMDLDPNSGVWIRDITKPVNDQVSQLAGQELNWYKYGQAETIDDFRFMLDYDIRQNGAPLITGLYTAGLPGWGGQDVGHIVAVYGYYQDGEGKEFVTYADTAPAASGYEGPVFHTVELGTFWEAVSGNSAQVW